MLVTEGVPVAVAVAVLVDGGGSVAVTVGGLGEGEETLSVVEGASWLVAVSSDEAEVETGGLTGVGGMASTVCAATATATGGELAVGVKEGKGVRVRVGKRVSITVLLEVAPPIEHASISNAIPAKESNGSHRRHALSSPGWVKSLKIECFSIL